uniref:Uncharacterized protein n=1 Tax=Anguilla anguilla TaxID=7936 RepID=A0A0E9PIY6_ANGAN
MRVERMHYLKTTFCYHTSTGHIAHRDQRSTLHYAASPDFSHMKSPCAHALRWLEQSTSNAFTYIVL